MDARKLLFILVALRASSRLLRASSRAARCEDIIFRFSRVPACTERKRSAFEMLILACCKKSVKMCTVDWRNV